MNQASPSVIILAGPNGAGKSTLSHAIFASGDKAVHYVNADTIAKGLSAFRSEEMAFKAGKVMLEHLHELAQSRHDFGFETTLATKSFLPWLVQLKQIGYKLELVFLWLPAADMAVNRVRERVAKGGHNIPEQTIRRRYVRGVVNFFDLYQPAAERWQVFENVVPGSPRLIAQGFGKRDEIFDEDSWKQMREVARGST